MQADTLNKERRKDEKRRSSPSTLKAGIEQGVIPFGACIKTEKGSVTVLFPEKVKEYCGVNLDY